MLKTCLCVLALAALVTGQAPRVVNEDGIPNNGFTNSQTITFTASGTKTNFPKISCTLDGQGTSTCEDPLVYTDLADGQHTLVVQFALANGQVDTSANTTFIWTVDTTPPPKPQIDVKPGLQTNAVFPRFQFTVAGVQVGGVSFNCQLSPPRSAPIPFNCSQTTDVASSTSPVPGVPVTGLLEGPYTLQVNAIDAAGNHGVAQTYAFTVDLEAPSVVLDSTTPNTPNGLTTNSPNMTFAFHAIDMFPERTSGQGGFRIITRNPCPLYNCTMQCSLDNAPLTSCTSPITYTGLTQPGQVERHSFRVVATDNATNIGTGSDELNYAWNIDRIPPSPRFIQTPQKAIAVDTATFAWTTSEPSGTPPHFFCSLDNAPQFNCTRIPVGGVYTWVLQNLTHSYQHSFSVFAVDYYGNVAPAISYAWQVDLHSPLVTFNLSSWATQGLRLGKPIVLANGSSTTIDFINFVFSTEPGSTTECQLDNNPWQSCTSPHTLSRLAEGSHTFRVRATDPVGHKTYVADQPYWTWFTDIDECRDGSVSSTVCHVLPNSECHNTPGSYQCQCISGYQSQRNHTNQICEDVNECQELINPCSDIPHTVCENIPGSYKCNCTDGYQSLPGNGENNTTCQDVNECQEQINPCLDIPHTVCENIPGSYKCNCTDGYQSLPGNGENNMTCQDTDECKTGQYNCVQTALCENNIGSYQCSCRLGYSGDGKTCRDNDECVGDQSPCDTHATCANTAGSFSCTCDSGYVANGRNCTVERIPPTGGLEVGTIAGIVAGVLVVFLLAGVALFFARHDELEIGLVGKGLKSKIQLFSRGGLDVSVSKRNLAGAPNAYATSIGMPRDSIGPLQPITSRTSHGGLGVLDNSIPTTQQIADGASSDYHTVRM